VSAPSANDLYKAAQRLVKSGQPVFPCHSVGDKAKRPLTRNGFKDATTDLDRIKHWLRMRGDAALGIPTGILYDVLDVDIKENSDGRVHMPMLTRLGLLNGCKKVVRTPSGGWHLYFPTTKGLTNKARSATLGLDVRSLGGYVIAAPSYLRDVPRDALGDDVYSGAYEDHGAPTGGNDDPLYWDLIVSSIMPIDTTTNKPVPVLPSERRASLAALREWVSIREPGERNNALHWAVCRCIDNGLDPNELMEPALLTGLTESEVNQTINSALKRAGVSVEELETEAEALFPEE
jgi:hypothetical protein